MNAGRLSASRVALPAVAMAIVLGNSGSVRANGAFPESLQILLPQDRPGEIVVSTNFGLILSDDGGKSWSWTCEHAASATAYLYQMGAPPSNRLFAQTMPGDLVHSTDGSCSWTRAAGALSNVRVIDAFPDRTDPRHVLAVAAPPDLAQANHGVYRSTDGGETFGPAVFHGPASGEITGIEIAPSDPRRVYVAQFDEATLQPQLVRSDDGGLTWEQPVNLATSLGPSRFRIVAVDPTDARRLYVRVTEPVGDSLAVSDNAGDTFRILASVSLQLTAFVRLDSGTILVAGLDADCAGNPVAVGFRSVDGGVTMTPWQAVPHVRALAARGGTLYVVGDPAKDGYVLGVSTDEGLTFRRLMGFDDVRSVRACVAEVCAATCSYEAGLGLWSPSICAPTSGPPDAGQDERATDDGAMPDAPSVSSAGAGCGCAFATAPGRHERFFLIAAGLLFAVSRRRRR